MSPLFVQTQGQPCNIFVVVRWLFCCRMSTLGLTSRYARVGSLRRRAKPTSSSPSMRVWDPC
ncbi:hypothetical protein I7I50_11761 [Histoplasma capsulatum G186AR]|uniref:Uncharacterized protein n=1 Tax=Ajellomyces capsulatus TaxID=5037 RepID=A0A8H8D7M2_AJECA|nr:hypothetical protein I7I52_02999 [Histoplasma capsulatum]QSS70204.1 hypothetical protein I7I50_11761 [Histoplasma capsulatum G186AR]